MTDEKAFPVQSAFQTSQHVIEIQFFFLSPDAADCESLRKALQDDRSTSRKESLRAPQKLLDILTFNFTCRVEGSKALKL